MNDLKDFSAQQTKKEVPLGAVKLGTSKATKETNSLEFFVFLDVDNQKGQGKEHQRAKRIFVFSSHVNKMDSDERWLLYFCAINFIFMHYQFYVPAP